MRVDVYHHFHYLDSSHADSKLDQILREIAGLKAQEITMNAATQTALDNLNAKVTENTSVEQSIESLLNGLSAQIAALKENQTDPAVLEAIDAAAAIVGRNTAAASAAVLANTPAA